MTGTSPGTSKPGQHAPEKPGSMPHKTGEAGKQPAKEAPTPSKQQAGKR